MKKLILFLGLFISLNLSAQYPRGDFASKDYVLMGDTEIVMKDGTVVKCSDKVSGKTIGKTNIDFKDVDYIRLIKTNMRTYEGFNGSIYKYIPIAKNKYQFMLVVTQTPEIAIYEERPLVTGTGQMNSPHGLKKTYFIKKAEDDFAQKINIGKKWKNAHKYFPDCPRILQHQKDKVSQKVFKKRSISANLSMLIYIYRNGCQEATPEELEKERRLFSQF